MAGPDVVFDELRVLLESMQLLPSGHFVDVRVRIKLT
jgi:hypothetical protein